MAKQRIMVRSRYELIVDEGGPAGARVTVSMAELAGRCGCRVDVVRRLVNFGLVDPVEGYPDAPRFPDHAVSRVARALRLKQDLGLNLNALALVMELLDRIEELEDQLRIR
ncbi:MAG TPA: chaperone modulator CbpM [Geobacteraceae bacterium]|nr:chaperone modulator CbpM [Geobacteraceae bacterium]